MKSNSNKNISLITNEFLNIHTEYINKFSKKKKKKKNKKNYKEHIFLKTILEQLQLQNSSLSQLIYKWYNKYLLIGAFQWIYQAE